jgi:hypothetical protein
MSSLLQVVGGKVSIESNASFSVLSNNTEVVLFSDSDNHLAPEEIRDVFIAAKNHWKKFVSIKPEMLAAIRARIPDFDGIKAIEGGLNFNTYGSNSAGIQDYQIINDSVTGKESFCSVSYAMNIHYYPGHFGLQSIANQGVYGCMLHELGHALGLVGGLGLVNNQPNAAGTFLTYPDPIEYDENGLVFHDPDYTNTLYLSGAKFPRTLEAYREIYNTNNSNIAVWPHSGHWISASADYVKEPAWRIEGETYIMTQHNDVMSYGQIGDNTILITKLSVCLLLDAGGYHERNPGVYETNENYIPPWGVV